MGSLAAAGGSAFGFLHAARGLYISYIVLTLLGALAWSTTAQLSWSP